VTKDLKKGDVLTNDNIRIIRPGYGEKPKYIDDILGMEVDRDVEYGSPFSFDMLIKNSVLLLTSMKDTREICAQVKALYPDKEVLCFNNKVTLDQVQKMQPAHIVTCQYVHEIPEAVLAHMNGQVTDLT
jgi:hypothetical protein